MILSTLPQLSMAFVLTYGKYNHRARNFCFLSTIICCNDHVGYVQAKLCSSLKNMSTSQSFKRKVIKRMSFSDNGCLHSGFREADYFRRDRLQYLATCSLFLTRNASQLRPALSINTDNLTGVLSHRDAILDNRFTMLGGLSFSK